MDNKNENVNILGFAGSLRNDSYNKMILAAIRQDLTQEYTMSTYKLKIKFIE